MAEDLEVITDDQVDTKTSGDDAGDKPAGDEPKPETDKVKAQKSVVPEKYDLNLPDGSLLPPSIIDEISAYAKEKGLSNEAAQEILNRESDAVDSFKKGQQKFLDEAKEKWIETSEADKEIVGVEGKDIKANMEIAREAVKTFDPDGVIRKMLENSGLRYHPEVIKLFLRIGKAMKDAKFFHSKSQSKGERPLEEIFYEGTTN